MKKKQIIFSILLLIFNCYYSFASGNCENGTILFKEDFGGNSPSDPPILQSLGIPQVIGYTYNPNTAGSGKYSLRKQGQANSVWILMDDHTYPNNLNQGYLMEVDGSSDPSGQFYESQIDNLCIGSTLYFSLWAASISPGYSEANMSIFIEDLNKNVLLRYDTGDIPTAANTNDWKQFGASFTITSNINSIIFRIMNNNTSASGNDFVLDDIEIRLCVPPVTVSVSPNDTVCKNESVTFDANFTNDGTFTEPLAYKWFKSSTGSYNQANWTEISTGKTLTLNSVSETDQDYYRVAVSSVGSIDLTSCRAMSNPLFLKVNTCTTPPPINNLTVSANTAICKGSPVQLSASGATSYQWSPTTGLSDPTIANPTASPNETTSYTVTGTFADATTQTQTVTISVTEPVYKTLNKNICAGDSFVFGAKTLTTSGTYRDTLVSSLGCDSTITLNLSVTNPINMLITKHICSNSYFVLGNDTLRTSGTYQQTFKAVGGCDSIVTVNLVVENPIQFSFNEFICTNHVYIFGNQTLSEAGTYSYTFKTAGVCDSIVMLHLFITPTPITNQFKTIYEGQPYTINGHEYKKDGIYKDTLKTSFGCDSIVITNLSVIPASSCPDIIIPTFFTPNDDGLNDIWLLKNIECYTYHDVEIFDRFGKMLHHWENDFTGWDGIYLGKPMPSSDYWYIIKLNKSYWPIYVGHFSLIRH